MACSGCEAEGVKFSRAHAGFARQRLGAYAVADSVVVTPVLRALVVTGLTIGGWLWLVAAQGGQLFGRVPTGEACRIAYVYDGDTVALDCGDGKEVTARLVGFDTPEAKSPGCAAEANLAAQATQRLRELVSAGRVTLNRQGIDKYRRPLMRLRMDGVDVSKVLIREGLAVPYDGGKRMNWCEKLST